MADLSQHSNYTGAYSGLLDNFYVTLAIAGACLIGYEIEVRIPRRRGRSGRFRRIPVRIYNAVMRIGKRPKGREIKGRAGTEGLVHGDREKQGVAGQEQVSKERLRLGSRESWEFG
jgi:hypothetical protein